MRTSDGNPDLHQPSTGRYVEPDDAQERRTKTRERLREQLRSGKLDEREVEITISEKPMGAMMLGGMGMDQMSPELGDMLERMMPEPASAQTCHRG